MYIYIYIFIYECILIFKAAHVDLSVNPSKPFVEHHRTFTSIVGLVA